MSTDDEGNIMSESIILVALALCIAIALLLARRPRRTIYDEPMEWQEPRDTTTYRVDVE